ncbi:MAG TPA: hypothetical protein VM597_18510 [Gemmataceae bacterium]|nr:hypothetical protein [Gemmataceae bacterium]
MSRRVAADDDYPDDGEEWGDDDTEYVPCERDNDPTMECPHCKATVFDESEQCPACGQYLSAETTPAAKPAWIVVTAVVCLIVAVLWAIW